MSGEIIAIVLASTGMAALMIGLFVWLRSDMAKVEERLRGDVKQVESQLGDLRERMAHLKGLLEGLREAIVHRVA